MPCGTPLQAQVSGHYPARTATETRLRSGASPRFRRGGRARAALAARAPRRTGQEPPARRPRGCSYALERRPRRPDSAPPRSPSCDSAVTRRHPPAARCHREALQRAARPGRPAQAPGPPPRGHRRRARVAFAKLIKQRVLTRSLLLGKRRAGGLDDILRARIPHIEREAVGMQQRAHVGVQLGQDAPPERAGAGDQQSVIGRDPEQIVQRPRDMAKMRLGIFDLRALVARLRPAPCLWRPWTGSPKETASVSRCADPRRMRAKRSSTSATHTRPADAGSVSGAMNGASDMTNPARTGWARRSNRSRSVDFSDKNSATARAPCAHSCAPPKISRARASAARRSWRSQCGRSPDSISRCAPPSSESISVARAGAVANYAGSRSR